MTILLKLQIGFIFNLADHFPQLHVRANTPPSQLGNWHENGTDTVPYMTVNRVSCQDTGNFLLC